jgi:hypothetical protein
MHIGGILGAKFRADRVGNVMQQRFIKRRGHADGLWKYCRYPRARYTV